MARASGDRAIEVLLEWGGGAREAHVLAVAYVARGRGFSAGEDAGCDVMIPREALGAARADLVTWTDAALVSPPARSQMWVDGARVEPEPATLAGERVVSIAFPPFALHARLVAAEAGFARAARVDRAVAWPLGISLAAHLACLAFFAVYAPPVDANDPDVARQRLAAMRHLLDASAERAPPPSPRLRPSSRPLEDDPAPSARPAARAMPRASPALVPVPAESARPARPSADAPLDPRSPEALKAAAGETGMLALVEALKMPPGEERKWENSLHALDAGEAHLHQMFDDPAIGESGAGGLRLSRAADEGGGGGTGEGVDILEIATLREMLEQELAHPLPGGFAHLPDRGGPDSALRWPYSIHSDGRIDRDLLSRAVRANGPRIDFCYAEGLRRDPALRGRLAVTFDVGPTGAVQAARDAGGDLPDPAVRACVVKTFFSLTFPPPRRGSATVTYPVLLGPKD